MLASLVPEPFDRPGWIYEEKYDGYRILAYKEGLKVTLMSRNAKDRTGSYPQIAASIRQLPAKTLLLDGEVVVFDKRKVSQFQLLQRGDKKPVYAVFDCLYLDGEDLRSQSLESRRATLEAAIRSRRDLFTSRRLARGGFDSYRLAKQRGYEGLVAKDASSCYEEKRSRFWLKVKIHQEEEFIIIGFTPPQGKRQHFGALLLGAYRGEHVYYVGRVGTGFSKDLLNSLSQTLCRILRKRPTVINPPTMKNVTYVKPAMVAQIAFQEWTADRKLRQPVFLGLRNDKSPRDVVMA